MRIVWKDSKPKTYKPVRYRKYTVTGSSKGWTTNIPGDNNVYSTHYCALNAIDKYLGGVGQMGVPNAEHTELKLLAQRGCFRMMKKCAVCSKKHNTYYKYLPCCLSCFARLIKTERHFTRL